MKWYEHVFHDWSKWIRTERITHYEAGYKGKSSVQFKECKICGKKRIKKL